MRKVAVMLAAVGALGACERKDRSGGNAPAAEGKDLLSVTGVVADVKESAVQVRTDDGRLLDFTMDDGVAVTLGGGESQAAVISEGAPVRVSYVQKGAGADLVSIDVEPQAAGSKGASPAPSADGAPAGAAGSGTSGSAGSAGAGSGGASGR